MSPYWVPGAEPREVLGLKPPEADDKTDKRTPTTTMWLMPQQLVWKYPHHTPIPPNLIRFARFTQDTFGSSWDPNPGPPGHLRHYTKGKLAPNSI